MAIRTHVAAAAPSWVGERLAGPNHDATVVHTGMHAIYVAVSDGAVSDGGGTRCIGLLSRSSSVVPCGLRTTLEDLSVLTGSQESLKPDDTVSLGEGILRLGSVDVSVGRIVDLSAPRLDPAAAGPMAARLRGMLADRLAAVRSELPEASLAMLVRADAAAVPTLLGRGSGLTPVGDDVLAGWLATMWAARSDAGDMADAVARHSSAATTLLSATLLDRAGAGDVLPEFRQLLLALRAGADDPYVGRLSSDVERMLGIGHTSGAGLMLGCLLALDHLTQHHPTARSQRS